MNICWFYKKNCVRILLSAKRKILLISRAITKFKNIVDYLRLLKGFESKQLILETRDGLSIAARSNIYDARIVGEIFLDKVYFRKVSLSDKNPIIVDIGAYIGDFSFYAAKYLNARVIFYEPVPENHSIYNYKVKIKHNLLR